jgi:hypothetical protein
MILVLPGARYTHPGSISWLLGVRDIKRFIGILG